jgi:hypothetical protein
MKTWPEGQILQSDFLTDSILTDDITQSESLTNIIFKVEGSPTIPPLPLSVASRSGMNLIRTQWFDPPGHLTNLVGPPNREA